MFSWPDEKVKHSIQRHHFVKEASTKLFCKKPTINLPFTSPQLQTDLWKLRQFIANSMLAIVSVLYCKLELSSEAELPFNAWNSRRWEDLFAKLKKKVFSLGVVSELRNFFPLYSMFHAIKEFVQFLELCGARLNHYGVHKSQVYKQSFDCTEHELQHICNQDLPIDWSLLIVWAQPAKMDARMFSSSRSKFKITQVLYSIHCASSLHNLKINAHYKNHVLQMYRNKQIPT